MWIQVGKQYFQTVETADRILSYQWNSSSLPIGGKGRMGFLFVT